MCLIKVLGLGNLEQILEEVGLYILMENIKIVILQTLGGLETGKILQ